MPDLTKVKFKENGDFNVFRGNTVVANLFHKDDLMAVVDIIQSEYRKLPYIDKFTLTPNHSIHMTVMELLCDLNRLPEYWSKNIDLDMPIDDVSDYFAKQIPDFPLTQEKIVMETWKMGDTNILVNPADDVSAKRLNDIRTYISENTGVRFDNHDTYQFHISTGYLRVPLTDSEREHFETVKEKLSHILREKLPTITIERIDYTVFDDMTQFIPYSKKK